MKRAWIAHAIALFVLPLTTLGFTSSARADEPPQSASAAPASVFEDASFHRVRITFDVLGLVDSRYALATEVMLTRKDSLVLSGFYLQSEFAADSSLFGTDTEGATNAPNVNPVTDGGDTPSVYTKTEHQYDTATQAYGFELQYRRYVKSFGPSKHMSGGGSGVFISPGLEAQHFKTRTTALTAGCTGLDYDDGAIDFGPQSYTCNAFAPTGVSQTQDWWYVGGSFDVGAQFATRVGAVISGSVGVHWRIPTSSIDESQYPWTWEAANGSGPRPRFRLQVGWGF